MNIIFFHIWDNISNHIIFKIFVFFLKSFNIVCYRSGIKEIYHIHWNLWIYFYREIHFSDFFFIICLYLFFLRGIATGDPWVWTRRLFFAFFQCICKFYLFCLWPYPNAQKSSHENYCSINNYWKQFVVMIQHRNEWRRYWSNSSCCQCCA